MAHNILTGQRGESIAAEYLERHGFVVVERNWRCHAGEIDVVAREGDQLVIVEVKTRSGPGFGHPFEALTPAKLARLYRLGVLWCVSHEHQGSFRVDAVAVLLSSGQPATVEHLRGVQ